MADTAPSICLYDTDDRPIWVTPDSGHVRLDLGTLHGAGGYRLFLTPADSERLRVALITAEVHDA